MKDIIISLFFILLSNNLWGKNDSNLDKPFQNISFSLSLSQGSTGSYGVKGHFHTPFFFNEVHFFISAEDYAVNNSYFYNGQFTKSFHSLYSLGFNYSKYFKDKTRVYFVAGGLLIVSDSRTHEKKVGNGGELGIGYDHILTSGHDYDKLQTAIFFESLYRFTNMNSSKVSKKDFFNGVVGTFGIRLYW